MLSPDAPLVLLLHGGSDNLSGKTGLAMLRYRHGPIVAVIDPAHAGEDLPALTGIPRPVPLVADIEAALAYGPAVAVVGLAPSGGRLPDEVHRDVAAALAANGPIDAETADKMELVTSAPDEIDWDDEVRIFLEERTSFSADGLTGLEANLRFAGPETMETRIFGRLTAWQNWIFQRPNAVGDKGALKVYGKGDKANCLKHAKAAIDAGFEDSQTQGLLNKCE